MKHNQVKKTVTKTNILEETVNMLSFEIYRSSLQTDGDFTTSLDRLFQASVTRPAAKKCFLTSVAQNCLLSLRLLPRVFL